jgi:uncharacterized protein
MRLFFLFVFLILNYSLSIIYGSYDDFVYTRTGEIGLQKTGQNIIPRLDLENEILITQVNNHWPDKNKILVNILPLLIDPMKQNENLMSYKNIGNLVKNTTNIDSNLNPKGKELPADINQILAGEEIKVIQEPKPPYPYISEDIAFENTTDGIRISGTLTYPKDGHSFATIILISDTGPQDRNESFFNHKPFLTIADFLTRNGFAVLRYDDRSFSGPTGKIDNSTSMDFASDVESAVEYLKTRNEIDSTKIGLIGHGEGGMITAIVAGKNRNIAFIISLAGIGLPGDELLPLQIKLISEAEGEKPEKIKKNFLLNKKLFSFAKTQKDSVTLKKRITRILTDYYNSLNDNDKFQIYDLNLFIDQQIKTLTGSWMKLYLQLNPGQLFEKIKCPVLALYGEKDLQVPPKENLKEIKKALEKSKNKNFELMEIPGLNHLFQHSSTGKISEYAIIEETISPDILKIMNRWIKEILKNKRY